MKLKNPFLLLALLTLSILSLPDAEARVRGKGALLGFAAGAKGSSASGPVLSLDQLRECVTQQRQIEDDSVALKKINDELKGNKDEIDRLEVQIARKKPQVDTQSQSSVDEFNAMIDKREALAGAYNKKLDTFNSQASISNAVISGFNQQCADHRYYANDMKEVLAGMQQKPKSH